MSAPHPQGLPVHAVQFLTAEGQYRPSNTAERFQHHAEQLGASELKDIYRLMYRTRRIDEEATSLQRQGELALWASSFGQEAAQAGAVFALENHDQIFPTYREHVFAFGRGIDPAELLRMFRGVDQSGWDPQDHHMQSYTIVLGAQALHAVGYAWGINRDQLGWDDARRATEGRVSVACFGDGASSEGDVHAAMVYAASQNTPTVFFCQNNQWAISVPFHVQSRVPISTRAAGYGFEGISVDGNDPIAMYAVTKTLADASRAGGGPVLIEAHTYRRGAHTTADDPTKYRTADAEAAVAELDPLLRTEKYLRTQLDVEDAFFTEVAEEAAEQAHKARAAVIAMVPENSVTLAEFFDRVYAEPHPLIAEEKAAHLEWEAAAETESVHTEGHPAS